MPADEPKVDSKTTGEEGTTSNESNPSNENDASQNLGNVTSTAVLEPPPAAESRTRARDIVSEVTARLKLRADWPAIQRLRNDMIAEARSRGLMRPEAREWAYTELDRLYPASECPEPAESTSSPGSSPSESTGQVRGLEQIPAGWPPLPSTASLTSELGWVQSVRLDVVEERQGHTLVHLDRAHTPPPSRGALGWLETSIRAYAKYVDVVARSMVGAEDEQQHVRREKLAIGEIRELLAEMMEAE